MRTATSPTAEPFSFTGACAKNMTYGVTVNFAGVVFRMTCVKAEAILTVQTICLEKKKKVFRFISCYCSHAGNSYTGINIRFSCILSHFIG